MVLIDPEKRANWQYIILMMFRILIVILSIIVVFTSCRQGSRLNEKEKLKIIDSVRQTLLNYHSDISKSGLLAELNYLDSTTDFFWVPPGYSNAIAYDSVVVLLRQNDSTFLSVDNSFDKLRIHPLKKDIATYTGRIRSTMTYTSGKAITLSLIESGVLIKRSGGWKLLNGQTTAVNFND